MSDVLYGLLSYHTNNIGDEIQSLAARQFLPRVDVYIDRDDLKKLRSRKKVKIILNGWFSPTPDNWPPSKDIEPLFISFHVSKKAVRELMSPASLAYLKIHQPIGCRDLFTQKVLEKNGIQAYFSGCLTLTLQKEVRGRGTEIILADLDEETKKLLPAELLNQAHETTHWSHPQYAKRAASFLALHANPLRLLLKKLRLNSFAWFLLEKTQNSEAKLERAQELLNRYSSAKLVLTSRLHCALPCLAFGTPVIFIHQNLDDPRFTGLLPYLHAYSLDDLRRGTKIPWREPLQNPRSIKPLKENLERACTEFITGSLKIDKK